MKPFLDEDGTKALIGLTTGALKEKVNLASKEPSKDDVTKSWLEKGGKIVAPKTYIDCVVKSDGSTLNNDPLFKDITITVKTDETKQTKTITFS